ncbi:probable G-protein coupled receptor Mth-like 3 [Lepeophtheirus salmonis]|uniref:probable G-protein coupled receptor Mth-like 3 n=1 Tax=Lepeophtheirus salmonis TaxID=72036 RepID=UPI001AE16EE6|nr:uncharacterized protein LOC121113627 [Lepeophtheirus salmonis]
MRNLCPLLLLHLLFQTVSSNQDIRPRKCCLENEVFDLSLRNCTVIEESKSEAYYNALYITLGDFDYNIQTTDDFNFSETNYIQSSVCPDTQLYINPVDDESANNEWFLMPDGVAVLSEEFRVIENSFCVDRGFSGGRFHGNVLVHCFSWEETCSQKVCVPTICPESLVFNVNTSVCDVPIQSSDEDSNDMHFIILDSHGNRVNSSQIEFRLNNLYCGSIHVYSDEHEDYYIDDKGILYIANGHFDNTKYRIYREQSYDKPTDSIKIMTRIETCAEKIGHKGFVSYSRYVWTMFLVVCQFLSIIFLLLLTIYLIKMNRRKLFGILTLCMTTSLFFFYLFLVTTQVIDITLVQSLPKLCLFLGYGVQFSYQTAIFWLNTMCIDIWCTFRYIRRSSEIEPPGWKKPIFKFYCMYAWGVPALISIVTITMNSLPKDLTQNIITPEIGVTSCFFATDLAKLLYFHLINFIVIIANVAFFTGSSWNLLCGVWADGADDPLIRKQNRLRHKAVFKLFFAMGISWLAEVISWIIEWTVGKSSSAVIIGSAFFDIVNALQGVTIFVVIVFDSANIIKIKKFFKKYSHSSEHNTNLSTGASMSTFGSKRKMNRKETPPTREEGLEMRKEDLGSGVASSS